MHDVTITSANNITDHCICARLQSIVEHCKDMHMNIWSIWRVKEHKNLKEPLLKLDLVEWAIATPGMYKSPFCVGNVHSLSYFQFQGIDGLYMSYKLHH